MTVAGAAARHSPMAGEEVDAIGRNPAILQEVRNRAERTAGHAGAFVHDGEAGVSVGQDFGSQRFRQFDLPVERMAGRAQGHGAPHAQAGRHDGGQGRSDAAQADHLRRSPSCIHHPRRFKVGFRIQAVERKAFRRFGGDRVGQRECGQAADRRFRQARPAGRSRFARIPARNRRCPSSAPSPHRSGPSGRHAPRSANCASASPWANSPASISAATRAAWRSIPAGIRPSLRNASPSRLMTSRGFSVRD